MALLRLFFLVVVLLMVVFLFMVIREGDGGAKGEGKREGERENAFHVSNFSSCRFQFCALRSAHNYSFGRRGKFLRYC